MKIFLLDNNPLITHSWQKYFQMEQNITIINDDFGHFMDTHSVECIVSPGNSHGIMDGGYDAAISNYFGWDLMYKVTGAHHKLLWWVAKKLAQLLLLIFQIQK